MNPNDQTLSPQAPAPPDPSLCDLPQPASAFQYRGNGKIARLPKSLRDQINLWMRDRLSYPDIIQRLGEHGNDLKPAHLCEWKKRGHQDWLLEQAWLAQTRARQEPTALASYAHTERQPEMGAAALYDTDFISQFILAGGGKSRREDQIKAIVTNPAVTSGNLRYPCPSVVDLLRVSVCYSIPRPRQTFALTWFLCAPGLLASARRIAL